MLFRRTVNNMIFIYIFFLFYISYNPNFLRITINILFYGKSFSKNSDHDLNFDFIRFYAGNRS